MSEERPGDPYLKVDGGVIIAAIFAVGIMAATLVGRTIPEAVMVLAGSVIVGVLGISATMWQSRR